MAVVTMETAVSIEKSLKSFQFVAYVQVDHAYNRVALVTNA